MTLIFFLGFTLISNFLKMRENTQMLDNALEKKDSFLEIFILNIITAVIFLCFYYANKYIEPAIVSAIEIGIGPIIVLLIGALLHKNRIFKLDVIVSSGILLGTVTLVYASLNGTSGVAINHLHTGKGLLTAFVAGVGMVLATIFSKRLSNKGWSTYKILAHRFYMLVPISFIFIINQKLIYVVNIFVENWIWIVVFTFLGLIIPLYLIQVGIKNSNPLFVSVTLSLGPVFTFIFQLLDPRLKWSWISLLGIVCLCLFIVSKVLIQNITITKRKINEGVVKNA